MRRPYTTVRGRMPVFRYLPRLVGAMTACAVLGAAQAADDAYLDQLDQEVTKVEPVTTDTSAEPAVAARSGATGATSRPDVSREGFETLLRRQHVGTYSFYQRLPDRSREEVYLDYSNGASMEALRAKIIDRYLHP